MFLNPKKGGEVKTKNLTEKQKRFADLYVETLNATQSYMQAYPTVKKEASAAASASKLLRNPKLSDYIKARLKEIEDKRIMDLTELMQRLTEIGRGESTEKVVTNQGDVIEVPSKTSDRIKAMELIGKRYSAWTDRKEVSGDLEINIGLGEWEDET